MTVANHQACFILPCWHRVNNFSQGGPGGHAEKQHKQLCSEVFNVDYMVTQQAQYCLSD